MSAGDGRARLRLRAVAALLVYGGSLCVGAASDAEPSEQPLAAQARPDLSGVWTLNRKLSEDPQEKLEQARERGPFDRALGAGRGARQGMARDHGMDKGGEPGRRGEGLGEARSVWIAPSNLSLSHQDPRLEMRIDGRRTRHLYTDNRGVSVAASGALQQRVSTAGWEKDALIVETTTDAGTQVVERYRLSDDGQRLLVTRELHTLQDSEPVVAETVYDRQPPGGGPE